MIKTHAASAIAVIAVVADVMLPNPLLPISSLTLFSFPPSRLSSPNCCCSIPLAMRRLPAGDAFMHPPVKYNGRMMRRGWTNTEKDENRAKKYKL